MDYKAPLAERFTYRPFGRYMLELIEARRLQKLLARFLTIGTVLLGQNIQCTVLPGQNIHTVSNSSGPDNSTNKV